MSQSLTGEKLQQAFTFPFRDPAWKNKMMLGSAVVFAGWIVPVIPLLFVYGYGLRLLRGRIVERREPYLPEWDNWGELLLDGLKLAGVGLVYTLPATALIFAGYALMMVPSFVLPFAESAESGISLMFALMAGGMALVGLGMILSLAAGALMPPAVGHMVATGRFGAAFRVREWWPVFRANLGGFIVTYLVVLGAGMLLSFAINFLYLTLILCCLIPFLMAPAVVYMIAVAFTLFGEAYRVGADNQASAGVVRTEPEA